MKLLYCQKCQDVRKLGNEKTFCKCGDVWGQYTDNINAIVSENCLVIGIGNASFQESYKSRDDISKINMKAWIMPTYVSSIKVATESGIGTFHNGNMRNSK